MGINVRIANVIEEGKLGGPQVQIVRLSAALKGRVDSLTIMPQANSDLFQALCRAYNVPYRAIPLTRITKECRAALAYISFSPWEVLQLARLFRYERIDLVHAWGGSWQYKALLAARMSNVPVVWLLNDTFMPVWVRRLFQLMSPLASGFIFASHRSRDYYGDLIRASRPEVVIPSTVDPVYFDPALKFERDADLPADVPIIGTVANINPIKGIETLIHAAAHLQAMGHKPCVVIVGAIPKRQEGYKRRLERLAKEVGLEQLRFVGARPDVRPLLSHFDVYVCSSNAESSPVAVWEAMAMGRPIVSTDVGDVARHVHDGKAGFIVPVGDARAMAARIAQLLEDSGLREQFGYEARKEAMVFSPEKIAQDTFDFYLRILAQAGSR